MPFMLVFFVLLAAWIGGTFFSGIIIGAATSVTCDALHQRSMSWKAALFFSICLPPLILIVWKTLASHLPAGEVFWTIAESTLKYPTLELATIGIVQNALGSAMALAAHSWCRARMDQRKAGFPVSHHTSRRETVR